MEEFRTIEDLRGVFAGDLRNSTNRTERALARFHALTGRKVVAVLSWRGDDLYQDVGKGFHMVEDLLWCFFHFGYSTSGPGEFLREKRGPYLPASWPKGHAIPGYDYVREAD